MVRLILRLLIVMFLLESSWAVAAQYCRHELGLDGIATSHSSMEHQAIAKTAVQTENQGSPGLDSDCPFCHLGAMKSMLPLTVITKLAIDLPHPVEQLLIYPRIAPHQPDRPNWFLAA